MTAAQAVLDAVHEETDRVVTLADHVVAIGDSLALILVASRIEDALDITLTDEELLACRTVGDLARAAEQAMGRRPS